MKKRNRFLSWLLFFAIMVTTFVVPATKTQAAEARVYQGKRVLYSVKKVENYIETIAM